MINEIENFENEYNGVILTRYKSLRANESWSNENLTKIRSAFVNLPEGLKSYTQSIAVVGSYGRLDASSESDFDQIAVVRDQMNPSDLTKYTEELNDFFNKNLLSLGLSRPNPKGIFNNPITRSKLVSIAGDHEDSYADLSRRILMLLESRYIYDQIEYENIINEIIDKYTDDVKRQNNKNFVFLMNDVIRYFRSICVNYQYTKEVTEWGKWPIRNIKLRHSRVIMAISLIAAIGAISKYGASDKIDTLKKLVSLEPLRRLYVSYKLSNDDGFFRIAEYYDVFLSQLNQKSVRDDLRELDYERRYDSESFSILKANSDALASEILRFFDQRRGFWSDRFFEYLLL